jgi:hypothetical protein
MLKYGEVNPLSVFGLRAMGHCPPHFEKVTFDAVTTDKKIRDWVYENLTGRFWLGDLVSENNSIQKCAAFELKSEASYFALLLPEINSWENNLA